MQVCEIDDQFIKRPYSWMKMLNQEEKIGGSQKFKDHYTLPFVQTSYILCISPCCDTSLYHNVLNFPVAFGFFVSNTSVTNPAATK